MKMPVVLDLLWKDHANMRLLLRALERQLATFRAGEDIDVDIVQESLQYCQDYPSHMHHPREDILLAKLRERDPDAAAKVGALEEEHKELLQLTGTFLDLIDKVVMEIEVPRDTLANLWQTFLDNYKRHMAAEERSLFVESQKVLTPEDWIAVGEALNDVADPVFGTEVGERFKALKADIELAARDDAGTTG
jgi:hemerythrin-like domain-containing protein